MVSSRFESVTSTARPPTPPKDHAEIDNEINDALALLQDPYGTKKVLRRTLAAQTHLSTPVHSPSSDLPSSISSSARKKRVNFELQTACAIPKSSGHVISQPWTPRDSSPLRPLPQTRISRPLKSILKSSDVTSTPPPGNDDSPPPTQTFAEMLETQVKLLAQGERPNRLDAYMALQTALQAQDKIPDVDALVNKMGLLAQFIRRDMQAVSISGSGPDTQLVSQALKFLMALFRIPELKPVMDDDFGTFVLDRCIAVTTDKDMPKVVINTHLAVLMQQNFRKALVTQARVEQILDMLDKVQEYVTGLSVQAYRIRIYRKLIQIRPDIMPKYTERWFKHTLNGMLSSNKEIRPSALEIALTAARTFGNDRIVTKGILAMLNHKKGEGKSFGTRFAEQLQISLQTDAAILVPHVWAAVTALLRDSVTDTGGFSVVGHWLQVLQSCLDHESEAVRLNANVAAAFLVYSVNLTDKTPASWYTMLQGLFLYQMNDTSKRPEVTTASNGYLTLLYYGFRPLAPYEQYNRAWKVFVVDFWTPLLSFSALLHARAACRTVTALLDGSRKPWEEYRALDYKVQRMIHTYELPMLDPKWVRKNLASILQFVESLLESVVWTPGATMDAAQGMWNQLLESLVKAGSNEVMATTETRDAIAHVVNMLHSMWHRHTELISVAPQKADSWADKFCFLIETIVQKLGALQFADKCLTRNAKDKFEVAPTPSNRTRHTGQRVSPLLYFLELLVLRSEGKLSDPVRLRVVQLILKPCLDIQNTRLARLELLRDCSEAVRSSAAGPVTSQFWDNIARLTKECLEAKPSDPSERTSQPLGKECETVVEILALGSSYLLNSSAGSELLRIFITTVRREANEGAVVLAVIEKICASVLAVPTKPDDSIAGKLAYASILLENLPGTISRRIVEQGRQMLYPSSPAASRMQEYDPYNYLYTSVISLSQEAYSCLDVNSVDVNCKFLSALANSVRKTPTSLLGLYLRKMQKPIILWVEDPDRRFRHSFPLYKPVRAEVLNLWKAANEAFPRFQKRDSSLLVSLEPFLCAGLRSKRRSIVNISVEAWNTEFGKDPTLVYPTQLDNALARLRDIVPLSAPGLKAITSDDEPSFDSDSSADVFFDKPSSPVKPSPFRAAKSARKSRSPAVRNSATKRTASRPTPKSRLRHEDSQIKFEPIASSPSNPFNQESQILTARQQEMMERQRLANLFARFDSSQPDGRTPTEELPPELSRTPMKAMAAMGAMDVFLGSSPTPQARTRSQQVLSDTTDLATPNAVRTVQRAEPLELGSSPPRFEQQSRAVSGMPLESSRQPERSFSTSFDAGSPFDEDLLPVSSSFQGAPAEAREDEFGMDLDMTDVPSSTIELQINAQLTADLSSCKAFGVEESNNIYLDARSQQKSDMAAKSPAPLKGKQKAVESFESAVTDVTPVQDSEAVSSPRRSARNAVVSTRAEEPPVKRKRGRPPKSSKKIKIKDEETPARKPPAEANDKPSIATTSSVKSKGKRKRTRSQPEFEPSSPSIIPETVVKPVPVRAASTLSQVMTNEPDAVDDTPLPKRTRKSAKQDVSDAKTRTAQLTQPAEAKQKQKQLSHVQVTPKGPSSSSRASSIAVGEDTDMLDVANATVPVAEASQHRAASQQLADSRATPVNPQAGPATADTANSQAFKERVIRTPKSIIAMLRKAKDWCEGLVLGRDEEKEIDDAMFNLRKAVHDAGNRGLEEQQQKQQQKGVGSG